MSSHPRSLVRLFAVSACAALVAAGCQDNKKVADKAPIRRYQDLGQKPNVPDYMVGTVFERVELGNTDDFVLSGFGLVVNLDHTGNNKQLPTAVKQYMVKQMVKWGFGNPLNPDYHGFRAEQVLEDDRVSVVQAEGYLPPGVRKGQQFDVRVSVLPRADTTSLANGQLYTTDLAQNGADPHNPFNKINVYGYAKGFVFSNPAYALDRGKVPTGAARAALRTGIIMNGGIATTDRPIFLRLRQPQARLSRAIEQRIISRFGQEHGVAYAQDEGIVQVFVPTAYGSNWKHFIAVVLHTYLNESPEFETMRAKQLAEAAVKPGAALGDISYCWEAIGKPAMPFVSKLLTSPDPHIAFAAARSAAFIGDDTGAAQATLLQMARVADHPHQVDAVQVLGQLPASPMVNRLLRELLDSEKSVVRIEAYKVLAKNHDSSIFSKVITEAPNNQKFILDIVPSHAAPIIYATRTGDPRIAIIGQTPRLSDQLLFTAMDDRLSITANPNGAGPLTIFYRDTIMPQPVKMLTNPDVAEVIARLGGIAAEGQTPLNFTYGEIVAVLQALADKRELLFNDNGALASAPFVLQSPPQLAEMVNTAPTVEGGRPQTSDRPTIGQADPAKDDLLPGGPGAQ